MEVLTKHRSADFHGVRWLHDSLTTNAIAFDAPEFEFVDMDSGRLLVNRRFSDVLHQNGLTTFDSLFALTNGEVVRQIKSRSTARIALSADGVQRTFYLKRHEPPRLRERLKPLLNLGRPIWGARNEWQAILRFHAAGIPTMTPVAFGEAAGRSLLVTEDLGTDFTLLDWVDRVADAGPHESLPIQTDAEPLKRELIRRVAGLARRMHDAGIHHQDFYLNHILWRGEPADLDLRVIDLGRVGVAENLSRRWILKDLAQLDFSGRRLSCADRLRFLRLYLGRPFRRADRRLVRLIAMKSGHIAAHTAKHSL
jgi:heptose I phosphotransferase